MEIARRPLRPQESKRVRRELRGAPGWGTAVLALATGIFATMFLCVLMIAAGLRGAPLGVALLVVLVAASVLTWGNLGRWYTLAFRGQTPPLEEADLRRGEVEEWRVGIRDAIVVEEIVDETAPYYLELDDGRVLFLVGQYLRGDEPGRLFPNRQLLITRLPLSGTILEVQCLGEAFAPSAQLPAFTALEHQERQVPVDGQLLEGPLSRFRPTG